MYNETAGQMKSREVIEHAIVEIAKSLQDLVDLKRAEICLKREELELLKNTTK